MRIKVDFTEIDSPTGKQIDLVQEICKFFDHPLPEYTFDAYSDYLSDWLDYFREAKKYEEGAIQEYYK